MYSSDAARIIICFLTPFTTLLSCQMLQRNPRPSFAKHLFGFYPLLCFSNGCCIDLFFSFHLLLFWSLVLIQSCLNLSFSHYIRDLMSLLVVSLKLDLCLLYITWNHKTFFSILLAYDFSSYFIEKHGKITRGILCYGGSLGCTIETPY